MSMVLRRSVSYYQSSGRQRYSLVSKLGPNVAHVDIFQRLVSLHITDLNDKRVRTEVLATDVELCHDDSVVGRPSQRTNPPFRRGQGRTVDGEGLVIGVICSRGLQTTDVRAVTQFRLCVASDDLILLCAFEEKLVLFRSSLFPQSHLYAGIAVSHRHLTGVCECNIPRT